jgi:N-acyl homoserine lactone hydrolase
MNVTDPIRRVSVVSTGQVKIRPDHVASTWRPTAVWLLASRTWTGPRPGLAILPAHDPGAADRLAQATGQTPELASA